MSYCRHNGVDSDVYVIHHVDGYLVCYCADMFTTPSRTKMIEHLHIHEQEGKKVPGYAFERLRNEIEELGDEIA